MYVAITLVAPDEFTQSVAYEARLIQRKGIECFVFFS